MKKLIIFLLLLPLYSHSQIWINSDLNIQPGCIITALDSMFLQAGNTINLNGKLEAKEGISTQGSLVNTGITGILQTKISPNKINRIDIGPGTNNRIDLQFSDTVGHLVNIGVREQVFSNPGSGIGLLSTGVVNRTWTLELLDSIPGLSAEIYWAAAEEGLAFNRNLCAISRFVGSQSSGWAFAQGFTGAIPVPLSSQYKKSISLNQNNAKTYYFSVGSSNSSLPVEWLNFIVYAENKDALLKWQTSQEKNASHFILERSYSGIEFDSIGLIKANGNSNQIQSYSYKDIGILNEEKYTRIYYRIKQFDFDGSENLSEIRLLEWQNNLESTLTVYPNPTSNFVLLESVIPFSESILLSLRSSDGKEIEQIKPNKISDQLIEIPIESLPAGVYFLTAMDSGNKQTKRIIKTTP